MAERVIGQLSSSEVRLYDNNQDIQGTYLQGYLIRPVSQLQGCEEGEIIICTTSIDEVISQLSDLRVDLPILVADVLQEFHAQSDLINSTHSFLLASGLPANNLHGATGGLFKLQMNAQNQLSITEVISGPCHSVVKDGADYLVSAQAQGIVILDEHLRHKDTIALPEGARPHGIAVTEDHFLVVASNLDALLIVDKKSYEVKHLKFSEKRDYFDSASHHANDIEVVGSIAYVSMFSLSGSWKQGVFDCGLMEINLKTGEKFNHTLPVKLPHSVRAVDNTLIVLNSFEGSVFSFGCWEEYRFNGFLRGFDYDTDYFYFAESRNRNSTPLKRNHFPSSIDSKINIVCRRTKCSKTLLLPTEISEIHSILKLH